MTVRRRVLAALALFSTVAVLAFAVPLVLVAAGNRTSELVLDRGADADRFATLASSARDTGDTRVLSENVDRYHFLYGDGVVVVDSRGLVVAAAGASPTDPVVAAAIASSSRGQRPDTVSRLLPWGPTTLIVARPVGTSVQVDGAVVLVASTDAARRDIATVWAVVAAGAVVALALFGVLAHAIGGWVLRPLAVVSRRVAELSRAFPVRRTPSSSDARYAGPPEIRTLARSFDDMAVAVQESTAAQRRLTADTAHTLRNPLTALTFRLDTLEAAIPDANRSTFDAATVEVARLTHLLDSLLDLAVAEEHPEDRAPARSDAVVVVHDRIDAWHDAFADAGVTLSPRSLPDRADTAVPADALAQMLDAPLDNAMRYAGPASTVVVTIDTDSPGTVTLSVTDDGPGVDPSETVLLTDRFYRASSAVGQHPGSGLGLAITRALADAHGGTVDVATATPHGLSVRIGLPAAP